MMKRILVLGAGRSSSSLIKYLLDHARALEWDVTVGDMSLENAKEKLRSSPGKAVHFDINNSEASKVIMEKADIIISLLPANFHPLVAIRCLESGKHLLTASYVSDEMRAFDEEARSKGLLFLNECGLDPGLDHLSAMRVIDRIRNEGGTITGFESFTGGLIAKDTDPENPWRYKFTWNPRNVVLAGQSTARYLHKAKQKYIPYQQLFRRVTSVHVPGLGEYEGYANRDSLTYIDTYGLNGIETMLRGTLRHRGFCSSWNIFVQLGCCDDSYEMRNVGKMTHAEFIESFLPPGQSSDNILQNLCRYCGVNANSHDILRLQWSGFFDETPVGLENGTPAQILEHILNKKWKLLPGDKDEIVMWHRFTFQQSDKTRQIQASLVATGSDEIYTAMAKTVGLPLGIAAKLLAMDRIKARGVVIPVTEEFYSPILHELENAGISLNELVVG